MTVRYGQVVFPIGMLTDTFNDDETEGTFDELNIGCVVLSDIVVWDVVGSSVTLFPLVYIRAVSEPGIIVSVTPIEVSTVLNRPPIEDIFVIHRVCVCRVANFVGDKLAELE